MAIDITYSVRKGYINRADGRAMLRVLEAIGFVLWDDALEQRERDGRRSCSPGLREFREHLGGELHVTLLRGIGRGSR